MYARIDRFFGWRNSVLPLPNASYFLRMAMSIHIQFKSDDLVSSCASTFTDV